MFGYFAFPSHIVSANPRYSGIRNIQQSMSQSIASKVAMHAPPSAHCTKHAQYTYPPTVKGSTLSAATAYIGQWKSHKIE